MHSERRGNGFHLFIVIYFALSTVDIGAVDFPGRRLSDPLTTDYSAGFYPRPEGCGVVY